RRHHERPKGLLTSIVEGAVGGIDVSVGLGRETNDVLGAVVTGVTVPFTAAGGAVVGAVNGIGNVFKSLF
uniref:Uncharacterized protein n=1 Tax=Panagrolaimus sp. ES5 TaxID=591445 RepID=A0AC34GH27_9BILA